jgi:catechol 2,3-dioxygenase-like lactoylglutathione lyase family enzyme
MSTEDNKTPQEQENAPEGSTAAGQQRVTLNWPRWIGLVVDDLEAQRRYYRDVVGLKERRVGEGYVHFEVGSKLFELLAKSSDPQFAHRGFQIGFAVANIAAVRAELISRGIEPVGDIESDSGMYWCYFKDPEGNLYEITEG